jgi:hypothetical protein
MINNTSYFLHFFVWHQRQSWAFVLIRLKRNCWEKWGRKTKYMINAKCVLVLRLKWDLRFSPQRVWRWRLLGCSALWSAWSWPCFIGDVAGDANLWNIGELARDYMAQCPRTVSSCYLILINNYRETLRCSNAPDLTLTGILFESRLGTNCRYFQDFPCSCSWVVSSVGHDHIKVTTKHSRFSYCRIIPRCVLFKVVTES